MSLLATSMTAARSSSKATSLGRNSSQAARKSLALGALSHRCRQITACVLLNRIRQGYVVTQHIVQDRKYIQVGLQGHGPPLSNRQEDSGTVNESSQHAP